ncbi:MAG: M20/M25/M40 family metallo-hydrolase [Candidatus Eiseniibacteriota bacterium]
MILLRPSLAAAIVLLLAGTAASTPFSPASLDSTIEACLLEVSADSLESYIQAMQDFTTRHTNSDTTSSTAGIGAARRWVHAKFTEFANQGGNITASYHTFNGTIGGITKAHRNVVGEIPGTAPASERRIYVIGGHLDSRNENVNDSLGTAYGADDDASGVACLLEAARVMSTRSWPHTLRFIAFTGEEQGLFGSGAYARDAFFAGEAIAAMLNNDTMASTIGMPSPDSTVVQTDTTLARVFADIPAEGPHRQFQRYLTAMGNAYVPVQNIVVIPAVDRPGRGGDHQSFNANGFTAIRYMEYLEETWRQHTALGDTLGAHLDMNYCRRNAQVDVATLGNLAASPVSPSGFTVADVGDSTGFRLVWPSTAGAAGYLITQRLPASLDYDVVTDVGLVNQQVVAPLSDSVWFGLSAYDSEGHRALVLEEKLGVLSSIPVAPVNVAASPDGDSILLTWTPNAEADVLGYHVHRSTTPGSGYVQITGSPVASAAFDDATALAQTKYYYVVTAVDASLNASGFSQEVFGQLVSLDAGILFVDETKVGATAWFPNDALADSVYAVMMTIAHDVWDVDALGVPSLSDLGPYSSVMWIADDFTSTFQGAPIITQFLPDAETTLEQYMDLGGNVMLAGWESAKGFAPIGSYPFDLGAGDFLYDRFGVDDVSSKTQQRFNGGVGQGFFADVALEPLRLSGAWTGRLTRVEYVTAARPDANVGYLFDSDDPDSAYHLAPCALYRDGGSYRAVWWGFPLYHLSTADAQSAIVAAMTYFGELPPTGAPDVARSGALSLHQNRPNPFRDATTIRYSVFGEQADVELAIFDLAGRRVHTLVSGKVPGGLHDAVWQGRNDDGQRVASGVYFYRLKGENRTVTKKLMLLR